MEAAGIEPAPGGAKLPAESRPYLATARNAWESISRRVPFCPAPFQPVPHAPATYVQHGGGCPPPVARHPGLCGLPPLVAVNVQLPLPGSCAGAAAAGGIGSSCGEGSTKAMPQGPIEARAAWIPVPPPAMGKRSCPGTACERAPTGTASALEAIPRTEQRLPCSSPSPDLSRSSRTPGSPPVQRAPGSRLTVTFDIDLLTHLR